MRSLELFVELVCIARLGVWMCEGCIGVSSALQLRGYRVASWNCEICWCWKLRSSPGVDVTPKEFELGPDQRA